MTTLRVARLVLPLVGLWAGGLVHAQEDGPDTRLFDTGAPVHGTLSAEAFNKRVGWQQVPEDNVTHRFTGAAVVLNDKLAAIFEKQAGPEIFSRATGQSLATAAWAPTGSAAGQFLAGFRIVENTAGGVRIECTFTNGGLLRFRLTTGEGIVEIQPSQGTGYVDVQSDATQVLVPDYFGDDMVYAPSFKGLLPAENFCLNLLSGGDAILMTVWQSNEQEASLSSVPGANVRPGCVNRISCLPGKNVWVAFLEGAGIWHAQPGLSPQAWTPPFPAKWRSSYVRQTNVADSWDPERGPEPGQVAGEHQGPLLTYLIDRTPATPLTATCPTDVMRNTLGVGPCQYILACEGMGAQGDPTPNSVMGWVEKQFQQKKQRKAADDIKERLGYMTKHVEEARIRIQKYAEFGARLHTFVTADKALGPLANMAGELGRFAAAGLAPDSAPERARQLAGQVLLLLPKDDALPACQKLGEQLRSIGAAQDRALARCRMAVRRLKQQARAIAIDQPSSAASAQQIQHLAQQALQGK